MQLARCRLVGYSDAEILLDMTFQRKLKLILKVNLKL